MTDSVPPTFNFTPTGSWQSFEIVKGTELFSVMLWGNDAEFNNYVSWAENSANKPTSLQYLNS